MASPQQKPEAGTEKRADGKYRVHVYISDDIDHHRAGEPLIVGQRDEFSFWEKQRAEEAAEEIRNSPRSTLPSNIVETTFSSQGLTAEDHLVVFVQTSGDKPLIV